MKNVKVLKVLTTLILCGLLLQGCGSSSDSEKKEIVTADTNSPGEDNKMAFGEEATDGEDSLQEHVEVSEMLPDEGKENANATIDEQVLFEQDGLKVTATEYVTDSIWGDGIKLLLENNGSTDVGVGCNALIVNDYMITDLFSSTVAAGKKANEMLYLSSAGLQAAGIDTVGKIEVYFHTFDPDSFMTIKNMDCVTIQTSGYDTMDTIPNDAGQELYSENGIRIVGKYVDESSFWGAAILLYIENNSGKNAIIQCDDMSINGFMMTPFFSSTVYDGKKAIDEITLMSSELEENGITSVEEVELKFRFVDDNYTSFAESDAITFNAK